MGEAHISIEHRRVGKVFACFSNQVRHGLGRRAGTGPCVVRADDALLQILPAPGMNLLSLRPRLVQGARGMECFVHCREDSGAGSPEGGALVAVYRYGASAQVHRHPAGESRPLGILSDSDVALAVALTLVSEAHQRAARGDRPPAPARRPEAGRAGRPAARPDALAGPVARAGEYLRRGLRP